jgi:zinc protease
MMKILTRSLLTAGLALSLMPAAAMATEADDGVMDIPYTRYVLDNGLTLIVHEDHKAPIVAVNVWYDVGSGDEPVGSTGFAHLFEHLMFNGSEHYPDDYFGALVPVGATGTNGTTNTDRTNYFEVVPITALDRVLWLESDRMGYLLGAVDQDRLDEQRGVVQNEKRQGENQPYGRVWTTILERTYPEGHPYNHSTIGSMDDLDAASLDDVHEWFQGYYGAANTVVAVVGDVDPEDVRERVERYFGHIASGPPLSKSTVDVAPRSEDTRHTMYDRVPQTRIYKVWNVPALTDRDHDLLEIAAGVLANGRISRLNQRLVYEDQIATDVGAFIWSRQLGSSFVMTATVAPGEDPAVVEAAMEEELARFLREGPDRFELERIQQNWRINFAQGAERIGGFGGTSDVLARSQVYFGSPDGYQQGLRNIATASRRDVRTAANTWLTQGIFTLTVEPYPNYSVSVDSVDRDAGIPEVTEFPAGAFPQREQAALANGLRVILARRDTVPLIQMQLMLDAGYAADQFGLPGTANIAMGMLTDGAGDMDALEISREQWRLGTSIGGGSNLDRSFVGMTVLRDRLAEGLDLYSTIILDPTFPDEELERSRRQTLASIQQEQNRPFSMALRVFPRLLYGDDHAYGMPLTGSGTADSVNAIARDDLVTFHDTWFRPNNATLIVVGDITMPELLPMLEARFGGWESGEVPSKNLSEVPIAERSAVYVVDRPDSQQSIIFAGHVMPPKSGPDEVVIDAANTVLGGGFTSRMNMNLREDKHWAYGAGSFIADAAGQQPFIVYAPVQTDRTADSMAEIQRELDDITGDRGPTDAEMAEVQQKKILTLPGRWETGGAVLNDIIEMVRFGYPDDYWDAYPDSIRALTTEDLAQAAREYMHPDRVIWVVVGDWSVIEESVRALDLGEIHLVDADGNPAE